MGHGSGVLQHHYRHIYHSRRAQGNRRRRCWSDAVGCSLYLGAERRDGDDGTHIFCLVEGVQLLRIQRTWVVLKSTVGFSNGLDSNCKKWRLFADILNDGAMFVELLLPHFSSYSLQVLCLTSTMKALVIITRIQFTGVVVKKVEM